LTSLYNLVGQRKYLSPAERAKLLRVATEFPLAEQAFCRLMVETGCRISEALVLTIGRIDFSAGAIVFESLKKRRRGVFRSVPLSPDLCRLLEAVVAAVSPTPNTRVWAWSRMTAFRKLKAIMAKAGITGAHAMPKGLRHGFAIAAVDTGVPLNMVQKWMGHAALSTTAIYANAIGPEERRLARRMWKSVPDGA